MKLTPNEISRIKKDHKNNIRHAFGNKCGFPRLYLVSDYPAGKITRSMVFRNLTCKKAANSLVEALQMHASCLLHDPIGKGITDLFILEKMMWDFANNIDGIFSRCKLSDLKSKVHESEDYQSYNLIHKRDNILNSITIHLDFVKELENPEEAGLPF